MLTAMTVLFVIATVLMVYAFHIADNYRSRCRLYQDIIKIRGKQLSLKSELAIRLLWINKRYARAKKRLSKAKYCYSVCPDTSKQFYSDIVKKHSANCRAYRRVIRDYYFMLKGDEK